MQFKKTNSLPTVPDSERLQAGFCMIPVRQPKGKVFIFLFFTMDYNDKLKSDQWKRVRAIVLERDGFECQRCGHESKSNEVHHLVYKKDKQPWQYSHEELITLCRDCHQHETENIKEATNKLVYAFRTSGMLSDELLALAEAKPKKLPYFHFTVNENMEV